MPDIKAKPLNQVIAETPELKVNGEWLCLNIDTRTAWPTKPQAFTFEGYSVWVMPRTTDSYPGLAAQKPETLDRDECYALLHRALSALAWIQDTGAVVVHMSGGNLPRMVGMRQPYGYSICDDFDLSDLPVVEEASGRLALALIREGRGINHPGFSFLSFFRVLEAAIPNSTTRSAWVTENLNRLDDHRAKDALDKLKVVVPDPGDIGKHLYESGRCAITHAKDDAVINPDDPRDARRLEAELPIIEGLAVLAVEDHLGIQTTQKAWEEHF